MPASVAESHPIEADAGAIAARARAKAVARPERVIAARVFDAAVEASGLSNRLIARWLGVDERRVREMRAGERPVTLDHLLLVPPAIETGVSLALDAHANSRAIGGR